jgi:hypothetical protein
MPNDTQISPNMSDKLAELEILKIQSEHDNLAEQLNLKIPHEVTVEERLLWGPYFNTIIFGYKNELLDATDIQFYLDKYDTIPNVDKLNFNNRIFEIFDDKILFNAEVESVLAANEIIEKNKEIAKKLDPDQKNEFYHYMRNGEGYTAELKEAIEMQKTLEVEEASLYKLNRAFDSKQTLNIGLREPQKGKALTPDQVAAKFNLESSIASDQDEEIEADDRDPMAKISSQTQSLYELVKLNRDKLTKDARNKKNQTQFEIDEDIVTRSRSKPAGLDELLKK